MPTARQQAASTAALPTQNPRPAVSTLARAKGRRIAVVAIDVVFDPVAHRAVERDGARKVAVGASRAIARIGHDRGMIGIDEFGRIQECGVSGFAHGV